MSVLKKLNGGNPISEVHVREEFCYGDRSKEVRAELLQHLIDNHAGDALVFVIRWSGIDGVPCMSSDEMKVAIDHLIADKKKAFHPLNLLTLETVSTADRARILSFLLDASPFTADILRDQREDYRLTDEEFALLPAED